MIVKDEAANIGRLFSSIHRYIDYYVISDTGSTDNTIELVAGLAKKHNIKGKILQHKWVDFAHNRNLVLNSAISLKHDGQHNCNWLMVIDADEELVANKKNWHKYLTPGVNYLFKIKYRGTVYTKFGLLWINGKDWKWEGKVHEQLKDCSNSEKKTEVLNIDDVYFISYSYVGAYSRQFITSNDRAKYEVNILDDELKGSDINRTNIQRYIQLAKSLMSSGDYTRAVGFFDLAINFKETTSDRRYMCQLLVSECLAVQKYPFPYVASYILQAIHTDPTRKEAYYYLGVLYRQHGNAYFAKIVLEKAERYSNYPNARSRVWVDIYLWKNKYELALVCFQLGQFGQSIKLTKELINNKNMPPLEEGFLQALLKRFEK